MKYTLDQVITCARKYLRHNGYNETAANTLAFMRGLNVEEMESLVDEFKDKPFLPKVIPETHRKNIGS